MSSKNYVYIGQSLDGFISDKNDGLEWLDMIPNPDQDDMGYYKFMDGIDAMVMGRKTFEVVDGFGGEWPYKIPVFVLSNSMKSIPSAYEGKISIVNGSPIEVLKQIHQKGYHQLYIDGGSTIQRFLKEDLIDEIILTTLPILLGGGASLFSELPNPLTFEFVKSSVYLGALVQSHYKRKGEID